MKAFIFPFAIALLAGVGVAGGTAFLTAKRPPAPTLADSSKHLATDSSGMRVIDSAGAVTTPPVAGAAAPAHSDTSPLAHAAATGKPDPVATSAAPAAHPAPTVTKSIGTRSSGVPKVALAVAATGTTDAPPGEKRIARVIAAMAPRDAAKMLAQMADHDVAIIIGNLTEKQEAAILTQLPADRLAAISKLALRPAAAPK